MKAPTKSKTKLMKRFQIEASKSKKAGLEPNISQRHLKSDFDSARRDGDKNDKSHSESESEEEKENEQLVIGLWNCVEEDRKLEVPVTQVSRGM